MDIGKAIHLVRAARGITQEELARRAAVSESYISLLEHNKRDVSIDTLSFICLALDCPLFILSYLALDPEEREQVPLELRKKLSEFNLEHLKKEGE